MATIKSEEPTVCLVCCSDVLRLDTQNADAIYVRAMCLYYQDGLDKAFSHLTHILKIAPDHKKALPLYKVSLEFPVKELGCGKAAISEFSLTGNLIAHVVSSVKQVLRRRSLDKLRLTNE